MRRYDDPVHVRTENTASGAQPCGTGSTSGRPAQFLWRGQLWQVKGVLAHWVETGEWWRGTRARAVAGSEVASARAEATFAGRSAESRCTSLAELLAEREVWRVEAGRPVVRADGTRGTGVFELVQDLNAGQWQLVGCSD